jgi:transcriptional regulator with XRE-family HTH domain
MEVVLGLEQMKLDKNLKRLMATQKMSLKTLSVEVGLPSSTVHGWLNGAVPKSLVDLKKIADHFGVSIDELCFGSMEKKAVFLKERVVGDLGNIELVLRQKDSL